jgi:hypothetical protein
MRLCAFLEAWVQLFGRRETGLALGEFNENSQTGATELINLHIK